ncbi:MAG: serine/threonine-protein kinase [Planctomycetota bacterium]|nr:serine/threonine-protein kinase [Planctomycetota bacterium]
MSDAPQQPSYDELSSEQIGPYRIIEELGRGGQGLVYLAEDTRLGRKVALKVLTSWGAASEQVVARFRREAAIASKLDHPGICTVYETGTAQGVPYLAMRHVEGESLSEKIATAVSGATTDALSFIDLEDDPGDTQVEEVSPDTSAQSTQAEVMRVVRLMENTARALHAAHEAGVIHRDIKPGNIMITPDGASVILDFGLARESDGDQPTLTQTGDLFGTPAYMAPEQLLTQRMQVDRRADVWALGVTLYECLCMKRPFEAPTRDGLYQQILHKDPPDVRKLNPSVHKDLAVIVHTATEKERDRRYQTALDLAEDLRRFRSFEPIQAKPVSAVTKLVRWAQRNTAVAAGLVAVLLSLTAGLVVSLNLLAEVRVERDRVDFARRRAEDEQARTAKALKRASAVNAFLNEDVLGQVSPEDGNKDVLVREILDKAAQNIEGKFDDYPEIEADIRNTIGSTYWDLGQFDLAQPHLERAFELRREHLGEDHQGTLAAMGNLGLLYEDQGTYDLALPLFEKALEVSRRVLGEEHSRTLQSMRNLGFLYKSQGIYRLALPLYKRALEGQRRVLGEAHPTTLEAMNNLGALYEAQGEGALALPLYEGALQGQRRDLGEEHPSTLASMNNLGMLYAGQGKYALALALYQEALVGRRRVLGEEHPSTLLTMNNLGSLYKSQRKYDLALPLYEKTLEVRCRVLGEEHPDALNSMNNLGALYVDQEKYELALPLYEKALEGQRRVLGEGHPRTLNSMNNLGVLYHSRGEDGLAQPYLERALELRRESLGEEHPSTLTSMANLGALYRSQGSYDLALPLYEGALEAQRHALGEEHPDTLTSMGNLGAFYMSQGNYERALPLYEKALNGRRRVLGEEHPSTLITQAGFGICLTNHKAYAKAEPLLLDLYSLRLKVLGAEHQSVIKSIRYLVSLYEQWGRAEEAGKWRVRLPPKKEASVPLP